MPTASGRRAGGRSAKSRKKLAIQSVIRELMDRVMEKVLVQDPFQSDLHKAKRPLYAALVPDEIFKGSHFERRLVTPFGGVWEKLTLVAATEGLGRAALGKKIVGTVRQERLRRIAEVLNWLEHGASGMRRKRPNWSEELEYVLAGGGIEIPVTVICDVYVEDVRKEKKYAFELKAPLPNADQTKVSKEKLLKLYSMHPLQIDAVNEIGQYYRERIYREYLGIEPPRGLGPQL